MQFRLILEEKTELLSRGGIANLPFVENISNLPKVPRAKFLGSDGHARLPASRALFQRLLACLKFRLDSEDLFWWYKPK